MSERWNRYVIDAESEVTQYLDGLGFKESLRLNSTVVNSVQFTNQDLSDVVILLIWNNRRSGNCGVEVKSTDSHVHERCDTLVKNAKVRAVKQSMSERKMYKMLED